MSQDPASAGGERPFWVLLVQRDAPDVLYEAAAMTAAAVSLGVDVTLVWFDRALDLLASGQLHEDASGLERAARLFAEARETGRVRMLACSASMVGGKGSPEAVRQRVDGIVGWPTTISLIRRAERSFIW
ncbi:MAG TPA: DsrE family protein [Thermoanaerobaculia bacterium]|nr:DsrE family protein [Thermoanaerobaculia bacterium]